MNGGFKKIVTAAVLATVTLIATPSVTKACAGTDSVTAVSNMAAQINFLGHAGDGVWFNVKYANPKGESFTLLVKNAEGDVLFRGTFTDTNFSKKIKILSEENDTLTPTFIIKTADNKRIAQSFQVDATSRTIDEVIVTRS